MKGINVKLTNSDEQEFFDKGWALIEDASCTINDEVEKTGPILRDNPRIWGQFLNRWSNRQWLLILFAVEELQNHYPEFFRAYQVRSFERAQKILQRGWLSEGGRVLDEKRNKPQAWSTLMCITEVYNAINDSIHTEAYAVNQDIKRKLFDV